MIGRRWYDVFLTAALLGVALTFLGFWLLLTQAQAQAPQQSVSCGVLLQALQPATLTAIAGAVVTVLGAVATFLHAITPGKRAPDPTQQALGAVAAAAEVRAATAEALAATPPTTTTTPTTNGERPKVQ